MNIVAADASRVWRSAAVRGAMFFSFWVVLTLGNRSDLIVGFIAAIVATRVSLFLLPPATDRLSWLALTKFVLHFFSQSVVAGFDVARRAFDPKLPLRPGYVQFPCPLATGPARSAFCALSSLLPGTVPVESDETGIILVHCLDTREPVVEQLYEDVGLFRKAVGAGPSHA